MQRHHVRSSRLGRPALLFGGLLALLAALLLAACASDSGEGDAVSETTAAAPDTTAAATETTTTTAALKPEVDPAEAGATPLDTSFGSLQKGTYLVDTLGSPFSFTVNQSNLFVQQNTNRALVLTPPNSQEPDDRDMVFFQLSALPDPAAPTTGGGDWPVDDFGGWLDNLIDGVLTSDREEMTLGGVDATRVELELGDLDCCIRFGSGKTLDVGSTYRIWVMEPEAEDPLAVVLGITNESDRAWFDAFENILTTLNFDAS